ncbi:MAG: hypothetical protein RLZZ216_2230 [Cyanobacteriota bacterium]|jgi:hypothetical protein
MPTSHEEVHPAHRLPRGQHSAVLVHAFGEVGLDLQVVDQVTVIPGRLGLHQECGGLLARQLLSGGGSFG